MHYEICFINWLRYHPRWFDSELQALEFARAKGFEVRIERVDGEDRRIMSEWKPIGGYKCLS